MTIGSFDRDSRILYHWTKTVQPQGWIVQQGDNLAGIRETKSWSGSDYPSNRPVYEKYVYRLKDGTIFRGKRRVDQPTRLKSTDHAFSATITRSQTSTQDWDRYEYGALSEQVRKYLYTQSYAVESGEWSANDTIGAIGKLRTKIAGSDFNAGVFLAECGKALGTITDSATRIAKFLSNVRRGRFRRALSSLLPDDPARVSRVPKQVVPLEARISRFVLEVQYAWRPILDDAHASAEFLAKQLEFPLVQTYRVRVSKPLKLVPVGPPPLGFASGSVTNYQIIARVSEVNVAQLSGLLDPASVAWEAVPWTFLYDWFMPIGSYLAARSLATSLTGTFVSTKTRIIKFAHGGSPNTDNGIVKVLYSKRGEGFFYETNVSRSVSTSLFVPFPNWKRLDQVASWQHALNATALLFRGGSWRNPLVTG